MLITFVLINVKLFKFKTGTFLVTPLLIPLTNILSIKKAINVCIYNTIDIIHKGTH